VLQTQIAADGLDLRDGVGKFQIAKINALLDGIEDHGGHAELKQVGSLRHIGIANDDVQATPVLGVGVWLIAGVNDAAVKRGL
jgi:hypothetical protein